MAIWVGLRSQPPLDYLVNSESWGEHARSRGFAELEVLCRPLGIAGACTNRGRANGLIPKEGADGLGLDWAKQVRGREPGRGRSAAWAKFCSSDDDVPVLDTHASLVIKLANADPGSLQDCLVGTCV